LKTKNTAGKTKNMTMAKQRGKTETDRTAEQAYHWSVSAGVLESDSWSKCSKISV